MEDRAYIKINGSYRKVYVLGKYQQTTLDGGVEDMVTVKLTKSSSATTDVEANKLETRHPGRKN